MGGRACYHCRNMSQCQSCTWTGTCKFQLHPSGSLISKSIAAEHVTRAIIDTLRKINPGLDPNKIIAQTYNRAANIQEKNSGVQKRVREIYVFFAMPFHYINHQQQLTVKGEAKGH